MYKRLLALVFTAIHISIAQSQSNHIFGYITDEANHETLIGASIFCDSLQIGTTSNEYGYYSLSLPRGTHQIEISYIGYRSKITTIQITQDKQWDVQLSKGEELIEVVVEAKRKKGILERGKTIPIAQLERIPTLMAETDILKGLALFPGVSIGEEGTSKLYVRGGTPDQNLMLLDGIPVYNVTHLGGFFGVFNADAINNVTLYKGDFPARYGGRLSSVIDIQLREGNRKEFSGKADLGIITSRLLLEGPISKKSSFLFAARTSYLGLVLGDENNDYWLYDLNGKVNFDLGKGKLFFSFYAGRDRGFDRYEHQQRNSTVEVKRFLDESEVSWGNTTFSARYTVSLSPKVFAKFLVGYTKYDYKYDNYANRTSIFSNTDSTIVVEEYLRNSSGVQDFILQAHFDHGLSEGHLLRYGGGMTFHHFYNNSSFREQFGENHYYSREYHAFLEDSWEINKKWGIDVGVRGSALEVGNQFYHAIEPRLSTHYQHHDKLGFKASYSFNQQYLHLLARGGFGFPNDIWLPATENTPPQRSRQFALGTHIELPKKLDLSIETYYKTMNGLIDYYHPDIFKQLSDWENLIEDGGEGETYGIEFLLEKKWGKLTGFAAYTLSWNYRQFNEINFGETYPFAYDRRHDFSIVGNYQLSKKWEVSANWVFQSGSRVTLPVGEIPSQGGNSTITIFDGRNNGRMPHYHRLDLGVNYKKTYKNGNVFSIRGSIYNAYHRLNPFYLLLSQDVVLDDNDQFLYHTQDVKQVTQWGIIPAFSLGFAF